MKKRLLCILTVIVTLFSGCGGTIEVNTPDRATKDKEITEPAETENEEESKEYEEALGGSPWINSDIKANITEDMETSAVDDFNLYVNYDWILNTEIPEESGSYAALSDVSTIVQDKAMTLFTDDSLDSHDAQLVKGLYNQYLDWDSRNAVGITPAAEEIEKIESIVSIDDLNGYMLSEESDQFVSALMSFGNYASLADSSQYILYADGIGFWLGGAEEYMDRTESGDIRYEAYQTLAEDLLSRLGYKTDDIHRMYDNMIDFESQLATVSYTTADAMSSDYVQMINNVYTLDEFYDMFTNYPIDALFSAYGFDEANEICVANPAYFAKLDELYVDENLEEIKDYLIVDYMMNVCDYLDEEACDASNTCENTIYGTTGSIPDEYAAYDFISETLTEPLNRMYLEKYDATEKKQEITEICQSVIETYREMLSEEDWLSDATKEKAIEKLDNITINAVYPDKWEADFLDVELSEDSFLESIENINSYLGEIELNKINGKVDRDIWGINILETNAYYDPSYNSINIILGILDGDLYSNDMTAEELYGGIGAVIGHEISHAFDTNGAQYDKDGNLSDWWTEEDYQAFEERAQKLADYYDNIVVWDGTNVNGEYIETEAIADMAGMNAMLKMAAASDDFDYETFFKKYGSVWAEVSTKEIENYYLTTDPHPLSYLRTNVTVQQFEEFYDTFGVKEDDGMYLAPEDRILVW